jgi:hypothetical protein
MNVPAARQIRGSWPQLVSWWGGAALQFEGTVHGAWLASCACILAAPSGPRPVPGPLSALYKASLGLNQSLLAALLRLPVASEPLAALGDGEQFMAWCDREGMLLGQVEVCAGSPKQIAAAWDALLSREGEPPPSSVEGARQLAFEQAADLALMAATYQGQRIGEDRCGCVGCRMLTDRPESWMDCPPDRQPDAVRGLFAAPHPGLEALLTALHTTDHAAREAAWRRTRA